jgi:hypothetical protein
MVDTYLQEEEVRLHSWKRRKLRLHTEREGREAAYLEEEEVRLHPWKRKKSTLHTWKKKK